jgi:ABC-type lipoprotein release transport system permease subunit
MRGATGLHHDLSRRPVACWVSAWRVSRIDPVITLKSE